MSKTIKTIHTLMATVVAILVPMIAAAQPAPFELEPVEDAPPCVDTNTCSQECVEECLGKLPLCGNPLDVNANCGDIPQCAAMPPVEVEVMRRVCEACHQGGRDCEASRNVAADFFEVIKTIGQFIPIPSAATPPPAPAPKAHPSAGKGQTAWKMPAPAPKAQPADGSNERALVELMSRLEILQRDVDALKEAAKNPPPGEKGIDADALADKIVARIRDLLAKPSVPPDVRIAAGRSLDSIERELENHEAQDMRTFGTQSRRMDEQDRRIAEVENRVSGLLGFELNVLANVHALMPYDNAIWGVWPEFFWLPEVADGLRLELGSGLGYAGMPGPDHVPLRVVPLIVGMMPRVYDGFHLGLGFQGEWRIEPDEHLAYSSYGGYLEPKYCPGNDGPYPKDEAMLTAPQHHFCFGLRAALEATIFQNPDPRNRNTYTRTDGSFGLFVGYAFLP